VRTRTYLAGSNRLIAGARGFTLVELLVVLAVFTAVAALALPRLSIPSGVTAQTTARSVAAGLRAVRTIAIREGHPGDVVIDLQARVVSIDGWRKPIILPPALNYNLVSAEHLSKEAKGIIRFYPDGSSTGGRLSISTNSQERHVDVNWLTGRVTVLIDG
jgi:general secretion pathway protein H